MDTPSAERGLCEVSEPWPPLLVGVLAVAISGAAQGGPRATAKTVFRVSLPDSGQIALAKLTLTVKAPAGKTVRKRIKLNLALRGSFASSAAVLAGPSQVEKVSPSEVTCDLSKPMVGN